MKRRAALAALFALLCAAVWAQSFGTTPMDCPPAVIKSGVPRDSLILELLPQNYRYVAGGTDTWLDSSGNGYNFTQATAANKPAYNSQTNTVQFRANDLLTGPELPLASTAHTMVVKMVGWVSRSAANTVPFNFNRVGAAYAVLSSAFKASGRSACIAVATSTVDGWSVANSAGLAYWEPAITEAEGETVYLATRYSASEIPQMTGYKWTNRVNLTAALYITSTSAFSGCADYTSITSTSQLGVNASQCYDIAGVWIFSTALATSTILDAGNW